MIFCLFAEGPTATQTCGAVIQCYNANDPNQAFRQFYIIGLTEWVKYAQGDLDIEWNENF